MRAMRAINIACRRAGRRPILARNTSQTLLIVDLHGLNSRIVFADVKDTRAVAYVVKFMKVSSRPGYLAIAGLCKSMYQYI